MLGVLQGRRKAAAAAAEGPAAADQGGELRGAAGAEAEAEELLRFAEIFEQFSKEEEGPTPALPPPDGPVDGGYLEEAAKCLEDAEEVLRAFSKGSRSSSAVYARVVSGLERCRLASSAVHRRRQKNPREEGGGGNEIAGGESSAAAKPKSSGFFLRPPFRGSSGSTFGKREQVS